MNQTLCPRCGSASSGRFCPECGEPLTPSACSSCGAAAEPDARYCVRCGRRLGRIHPARWLPWAVAGGALAALVLLLLLGGGQPRDGMVLTPQQGGFAPGGMAGAGGAGGGAGQGAAPPPLSGSMRENADNLFDRVMTELARGDTARASTFLPMAIQAYELADPQDADGRYHLSLLYTAAGQPDAGLRVARSVLEEHDGHLLALAAAAEAAAALGDAEAAAAYSRRFLERYDAERERALPEYQVHEAIFPEYLERAEALVR